MQPEQQAEETLPRRAVLAAALAAGGAGALALATGGSPRAVAQGERGAADIDLLNVGIMLEGLLVSAYEEVLGEDHLEEDDRALLEPVLAHEIDYVARLTSAVRERGGTPARIATFRFPPEQLVTRVSSLELLSRLEETVIRTWHGQLIGVQDEDLMRLLRPMIVGKGRHAAIVAMLIGEDGVPFPGPIETVGSLTEFLEAVQDLRADT